GVTARQQHDTSKKARPDGARSLIERSGGLRKAAYSSFFSASPSASPSPSAGAAASPEPASAEPSPAAAGSAEPSVGAAEPSAGAVPIAFVMQSPIWVAISVAFF